MVQHAIFFAGRAYLVHDAQVGSRDDETERDTKAKAHAQEIFENYLPPGLIKGLPATLKILDPENSTVKVFIGPYIDFEQEFSMGFIGGKDKVKYRAEAFLGREPTRFETYKQICDVFKEITTPSNCETAVTLDDNGG
jgi:hypothetical protein